MYCLLIIGITDELSIYPSEKIYIITDIIWNYSIFYIIACSSSILCICMVAMMIYMLTLRHFYIKWTLLKIVTQIFDNIWPILKLWALIIIWNKASSSTLLNVDGYKYFHYFWAHSSLETFLNKASVQEIKGLIFSSPNQWVPYSPLK